MLDVQSVAQLRAALTASEQAELDALLDLDLRDRIWTPFPGPQQLAFNSTADVIGFGGSAGGGKTDLQIGKALTKHRRAIVFRKNGTEHQAMIDRIAEIIGSRDGFATKDGIWREVGPRGVQIEFGSIPNPGDEEKYRGRPHDLKLFDEVTSIGRKVVEFLMTWNRTTIVGQHCQTIMTFNPPTDAEGRWVVDYFAPWLDKKHSNPAKPGELRWFARNEDGIEVEVKDGTPFVNRKGETVYPKSRTFIPSRVTDNLALIGTNYMSTLQALPEPMRSQMLYGDFNAGTQDDAMQLIPTEWADAAMARWVKPPVLGEMLCIGCDVARNGADSTTIAKRHVYALQHGKATKYWFDKIDMHPGTSTPDGPKVAGLVVSSMRDSAPINIDVTGVGSSPYDFLVQMGQPVFPVVMSETSTAVHKSGRLKFFNVRSEIWWNLRELLDPANNHGVMLPPDKELLAELCAPRWKLSGISIQVESREKIVDRVKRSPDRATAIALAARDTPKPVRYGIESGNNGAVDLSAERVHFDPYS